MTDQLEPINEEVQPSVLTRHHSTRQVVVILLMVLIAALLLANLFALRTLALETRRNTCFARLDFIGRPSESEVPSAARLCEGNDPLIEYRE